MMDSIADGLDEIEWRVDYESDINMISSFWHCKKCNHAQHQFLNTDNEWEAIAMVRDYANDHVAVCGMKEPVK